MLTLLKRRTATQYSKIFFGLRKQYISNATEPNGKAKESSSIAKPVESLIDVISKRRSEVQRSIIVKVENVDLSSNVYHYCKQFGEIKTAIAYSMKKTNENLVLLEYEHEDSVHETFKFCGYSKSAPPWNNRYLALRKSPIATPISNDTPLQYDCVDFASAAHILSKAESIEQQILLMYEHTGVNELATRLKFMGLIEAETIVNHFMSSIFPNARIHPFGSTLNGFGQRGCDLDMMLYYDTSVARSEKESSINFYNRNRGQTEEDLKLLAGRQVKCMSAVIDHYLPNISQVSAFSGARVPIVRYYDLNVPCSVDISVMNTDGFLATEIMYAFGMLDSRVRPFVFLVRRWAKEFKLTRHGPGDSMTNFQVSYMALSFLQNVAEPVIPTFDDMIHILESYGTEKFDDFSDKSFIFDLNKIQFQSKNTSTIFELFRQFLEYYQDYDFDRYKITLKQVGKFPKKDGRTLYLENMFRPSAVWGDNVSSFEIDTMKVMIREARDEVDQINLEPQENDDEWGILGFLTHLKPNRI